MKLRIPYIVSLRGSDVPFYNQRFYWLDKLFFRRLSRKIWENSLRVIANSKGLKELALQSFSHQEIDVICNGVDTNQNNVDLTNACITPGLANTSLTANCSANGPVLEIFEIQGAGSASPFAGQTIATVDNIVTAVGPQGFAIQ